MELVVSGKWYITKKGSFIYRVCHSEEFEKSGEVLYRKSFLDGCPLFGVNSKNLIK
ncbi:MAG: hypothetical protein J5U16_06935 [Candidatus Methanoperedens sp.]|nr:hypothetical protein [Candidatus Methanoperedens sp.]